VLSREDNEILVRVGPGTAMGNLMRRFWLPALLESELPDNDGTPVRIRLLGEDLVAFRDSLGRIGLLEEHCPHRRSSLALGANEDCGLRCLYHGWKFDVNGQCVDTPAEPEGATLAKAMRAKAYATHVAGGMIWAYMGPAEEKPPFPDFPWLSMTGGHSVPFKLLEDCNYAQAVEGTSIPPMPACCIAKIPGRRKQNIPMKGISARGSRSTIPIMAFAIAPFGMTRGFVTRA